MPFQRSHIDPRRRRAAARTAAAIAASALLNLGALALLERAGALRVLGASEPIRVALAPLPEARWRANRAVAPSAGRASAAAAASRPERAPDDAMPSRPVVAVAPSPDSRRPERARFLADRDNTVPRDVQLGSRAPPHPATILARPSAGAPGEQGIPVPGEEGEAERAAPGRPGDPGATGRDRIAAARLALAPGGALAGSAPGGGDGGARRAGRLDPRLLPSGTRYDAPGGGGPMDETLPGVATGDETMLNTFGFRFADFFRRVHDAIRGQWDPNRAWDARDPHDRILGRATRRVLLDIVLDPAGRLKDVRVVAGSGLDFFDRECVRAIEAASPFPNPPRALVNGDGVVVLRRYGLTFTWPAGGALGDVQRALGGG